MTVYRPAPLYGGASGRCTTGALCEPSRHPVPAFRDAAVSRSAGSGTDEIPAHGRSALPGSKTAKGGDTQACSSACPPDRGQDLARPKVVAFRLTFDESTSPQAAWHGS
jgi:hypothetical protein